MYQPYYVGGKRDKARRYIDTVTGEIIARRQYDQTYGRVQGSTYERRARETQSRLQHLIAGHIADVQGISLEQAMRTSEYKQYSALTRISGESTRFTGKTGKSGSRAKDYWTRKMELGQLLYDDMTSDDWQALMS